MNDTVKLCCCPRGGCEAHPRAMSDKEQRDALATALAVWNCINFMAGAR